MTQFDGGELPFDGSLGNADEHGEQYHRILVVDDDATMRDMIVDYLRENNMSAVSVSDWHSMMRYFGKDEPDLVILDLHLEEKSGLDLLREIRQVSGVPVIIITGLRSDEIDRIVWLEVGADAYLLKPFGLRELLARVRAVLRRQHRAAIKPKRLGEGGRFRFGDWELDRLSQSLTNPDGKLVALTKGEYAILMAFLDSPQRVLSREYLLQATRIHEDIHDRSVDLQVLRLRRKLEYEPAAPRIIQTERGLGYVFALPVERL